MCSPFPCAAGHWHAGESISLNRLIFSSCLLSVAALLGMEETGCILPLLDTLPAACLLIFRSIENQINSIWRSY
jgi:hypothetical protein